MLLLFSQTFTPEDTFPICICCQPTVLASPGPELPFPHPHPPVNGTINQDGVLFPAIVSPQGLAKCTLTSRRPLMQDGEELAGEEGRSLREDGFMSVWEARSPWPCADTASERAGAAFRAGPPTPSAPRRRNDNGECALEV